MANIVVRDERVKQKQKLKLKHIHIFYAYKVFICFACIMMLVHCAKILSWTLEGCLWEHRHMDYVHSTAVCYDVHSSVMLPLYS